MNALSLERKVDHHDGVFLDDADQQDDADQGHYAQIVLRDQQCHNRSHARRRQGGENRDGVDVTFVEHSQNDVHRNDGGQDEPGLG